MWGWCQKTPRGKRAGGFGVRGARLGKEAVYPCGGGGGPLRREGRFRLRKTIKVKKEIVCKRLATETAQSEMQTTQVKKNTTDPKKKKAATLKVLSMAMSGKRPTGSVKKANSEKKRGRKTLKHNRLPCKGRGHNRKKTIRKDRPGGS